MTTYHPDETLTHDAPDGSAKHRDDAGKGLADRARAHISDAQSTARETVSAARESVDDARRRGVETAQQTRSDAERFVQDNPTLALLGALGIGLLVGATIRGR